MRIACANWSRRHVGGIESYVAAILPALRALGHEMAFWSERDEPEDREPLPLPPGVPVWCAAHGLHESLEALQQWQPSVLLVHGLVDPAVEERLLDVAPSVFVAHSYYGTCISGSKTRRVPSISPCSRVLGPACLAHFYPRRCGGLHPLTLVRDYRRQTARLALVRRCDSVLTLSAHMRSEYIRHGIEPERIHQLPPYVPDVAPAARHTAPAGSPVALLFLGRMDLLKGCGLSIEALPLVQRRLGRPVRLVAAGDGPDRARCESLGRAVSSDVVGVEFPGWIGPAARSERLASADVLVFPSLWPEPYGLAGIEALAAGVPVAGFCSGAVPEWLQNGVNGALAPADPPTASGLADAVVRCVRLGPLQPWTRGLIEERQRQHVHAVAAALGAAAGRAPGRVVA